MKRFILTPLTLLLVLLTNAQDKLVFSYDNSGNQTLRNRICLNCTALKAVLPKETDSLQTLLAEEPIDGLKDFKIVAHPNPVTDILQVEWIENPERQPIQLMVFSWDGRKLLDHRLTDKQGSRNVDLGRYPPGIYLLAIVYKNGEKESFKIIKK